MTRRSYRAGWAAFVLAAGLTTPFGQAAAQRAEQPALTLEQAVEAAIRHSPAMVQSEGSVRTAEASERSALGSFLPSLSFSTGASLSSTERFNPTTNTTVSGSNDSYSAGLSSSVDLFTGGRRGAELRRSRSETDAAEASLVRQRYAVVLSVKRAFFDVLRADDLVRVAEARLHRADQGLSAAERRMSAGSATRSDVLRTQLERTDARQALLRAEHQTRTARFALGRLVGADGAVGARLTAPLEPKPLALTGDALIELVLAQSPAVNEATAALRSGDASARAARTQYLPSMRLSGGYDWFNQDAALAGGRTSWSVRVGMSYPLFNGFTREANIERAEVQARVARVQLDDARRAARADLERLLAGVELAEQQIALAEEAVEVAEEDLRVQQERYRLGAATILDQITSQLNLVQAELNRIAARYDYQLARAELEALAGRDL